MKNHTATFAVGKYLCTMTFDSAKKQLNCEWDPHMPPACSLIAAELEQYRAGRDALMASVAKDIGGKILIVG
jgi:hypothetical protein